MTASPLTAGSQPSYHHPITHPLTMSQNRLYTTSGRPTRALLSALRISSTPDVASLARWVMADPVERSRLLLLQRAIGPGFLSALAAVDPTQPAPVIAQAVVARRHTRGTYRYAVRDGKRQPCRPVIMQHIRTGRIIAAPSVTAFVEQAGLPAVAAFQYDPVFKGQKLFLHGWGMAEVLNRRLELKDVFGNRYEGTVGELRQKLSGHTLRRLMAGEPVGSLAPATHDYGAILPPAPERTVEYRLLKDGRVLRGATLGEVAQQAGISIAGACALAHGYRAEVKGVTFHRAKTQRRKAGLAVKLEPVEVSA